LGVVAVRYAAFYKRFGRYPEIHEPLLFDPSTDTPIPAEQDNQVLQILTAAQLGEVDASAVLDWLGLAGPTISSNLFTNGEEKAD
jgi:hypothetical protein